MTKIEFIIRYNLALAENNMLHRDVVLLAAIAKMATDGQKEATAQDISRTCGEPNAGNVLRRLLSVQLLNNRYDAKRLNNATHRVVYYSINQKGIETLSKIISF
jgi:hypothetical protein